MGQPLQKHVSNEGFKLASQIEKFEYCNRYNIIDEENVSGYHLTRMSKCNRDPKCEFHHDWRHVITNESCPSAGLPNGNRLCWGEKFDKDIIHTSPSRGGWKRDPETKKCVKSNNPNDTCPYFTRNMRNAHKYRNDGLCKYKPLTQSDCEKRNKENCGYGCKRTFDNNGDAVGCEKGVPDLHDTRQSLYEFCLHESSRFGFAEPFGATQDELVRRYFKETYEPGEIAYRSPIAAAADYLDDDKLLSENAYGAFAFCIADKPSLLDRENEETRKEVCGEDFDGYWPTIMDASSGKSIHVSRLIGEGKRCNIRRRRRTYYEYEPGYTNIDGWRDLCRRNITRGDCEAVDPSVRRFRPDVKIAEG